MVFLWVFSGRRRRTERRIVAPAGCGREPFVFFKDIESI